MAAHMHDTGEFAVRSPAGQLTPLLDNLFGWIDARRAAEIGRAATIWMPVFVLTFAQMSSALATVAVSSLVAAVWVFTVRSAFRAVPFTLGAAVPSAVGTLTGLIVVSALNFWLPLLGAELALSTLALMAVSVFQPVDALGSRLAPAVRLRNDACSWSERAAGPTTSPRAPSTRRRSRSGSSASSTTPSEPHPPTAYRCSGRSPTSRTSSKRSARI